MTTDLAPDIYGYGGKIKIIVGVDASNSIVGTKLISHSETPSFTKNFPNLLDQFAGKDISGNFKLGEDIDGITGATISSAAVTNAINESLEPIKALLLGIEAANIKKKATNIPFRKTFIPIFIFLLGFLSVFLRRTYLSKITMLLSLIYFGLLANSMLSTSHFSDLLLLKIPSFEHNTIMFILLFLTIPSCIILGRVYCCNICPFAAIQEMLFSFSKKAGIKTKNVNKELEYKAQNTKYIILFTLLFICIMFNRPYIGSIEPYITFFSLMGSKLAWLLLSFVLFSSIFYFRFWCRFFCPTGAFLSLFNKLRLGRSFAPRR
ncbi:MAG: FMN-binding protein, partial [Candidatus Omnitrophica bacterium]|nr:FMN-binding protein [Candidatus Omnitrophota bacterium]